MNACRVTIIHDACTTHDVEAESEQAAVHHAMNDAGVTLCHYCSHTIEVGDPIRAACVQNLDNGESNMDADPAFEVVQLRARVAELVAALDEAQQDAAKYRNIGAPIAPEHAEELQRLADEAVRRHHQDMADAARWRHLKRYATEIFAGPSDSFHFSITESSRDELDAAIDAARAGDAA